MSTPFTLLFALYPGVTQLDFTAPHQVFSHWQGASVRVASLEGALVSASGLHFSQLDALEAVENCDLLCLPGGPGCTEAMLDARFMAQIRRLAAGAHYITSVCTGLLILGAAGLLQGRRVTCHWSMLESLSLFGALPRAERVVRDGHLITGAGVTSGIDFALTVVAEVAGESVRKLSNWGWNMRRRRRLMPAIPPRRRPRLCTKHASGRRPSAPGAWRRSRRRPRH